MALSTFPAVPTALGIAGGGVPVFTDTKCTSRAQLFDSAGLPLRGNALELPSTGRIPLFQANASVLYVRDCTGAVITLDPSAQRTAVAVTGAKGGNAALTSLIAALSQAGIIVDQTT